MKRQSGFFHEFFDEEYPDQETKPKTASISSKEGYRLEGEKQPDTLIGLFCKLIELSLAVIGIYVGETRRHYKELLRQNEGKTDAELEDDIDNTLSKFTRTNWLIFLIRNTFKAFRNMRECTAIGNSGHPLNQDCDIIQST